MSLPQQKISFDGGGVANNCQCRVFSADEDLHALWLRSCGVFIASGFSPRPASCFLETVCVMEKPCSPTFLCVSQDQKYVFEIPPGATIRLGRTPEMCDVVIDSNLVSRLKAVFHNRDGECILEYGLNPPCPIWVNEVPMSSEGTKLYAGYRIKFNSGLIFEVSLLQT
jgi:hypothetical protein